MHNCPQDSGVKAAVTGREDLIRCRGSQSQYRGYPCTLWSLFHTLTVQGEATQSVMATYVYINIYLGIHL